MNESEQDFLSELNDPEKFAQSQPSKKSKWLNRFIDFIKGKTPPQNTFTEVKTPLDNFNDEQTP